MSPVPCLPLEYTRCQKTTSREPLNTVKIFDIGPVVGRIGHCIPSPFLFLEKYRSGHLEPRGGGPVFQNSTLPVDNAILSF